MEFEASVFVEELDIRLMRALSDDVLEQCLEKYY